MHFGTAFLLYTDKYMYLKDIWTLNSLSQILGFGPEPHPLTFSAFYSGMNSLCHTQQFDLRSVWLMEVK